MAIERYNVPSPEALSRPRAAATLAAHVSSPADRIEELRRDRSHGGSWLARHAVETLVQEAAAPAADAEELLEHLGAVARDLSAARPEMGSVAAATGRLVACATRSWALSASELRRLVLDEARALLDGRDRAARAIAVQLGPRLEHSVVLTHSCSATVREAVLRTRPERLLCTMCDGEGQAFAEELRDADLTVELVEDGEAAKAAGGVRLVLVGADTIYRDGTLLNRRGTRAIAEAAASSRVPVVVAAETIKLAPFPAPREPADAERTDLTPADLVETYVTEDGAVTPDEIEILADRTPFLREGYELVGAAGTRPAAR
jgi:translation initiation factor 2B subunit (eIF-2B alpha/beta/delta family)